MIEQARLLTLHAAHAVDTLGSRAARKQVKLSIVSYMLCPTSMLHTNCQLYILHANLYIILFLQLDLRMSLPIKS